MKGGERGRDGRERKGEGWGGIEEGGMGRDRERRDGEGWRGHGVVWREGGRGSRAHSPELVIARLLVIAHVLVVTPVLTVARVLVVARVRSWALAVIREPGWPFWLVVGRVHRGSWAMVKRAPRWVVIAAYGQWMVAGGRSRAVGGRRDRRLGPSVGTRSLVWAVVVGCGRLWLGGVVSGWWWSFS